MCTLLEVSLAPPVFHQECSDSGKHVSAVAVDSTECLLLLIEMCWSSFAVSAGIDSDSQGLERRDLERRGLERLSFESCGLHERKASFQVLSLSVCATSIASSSCSHFNVSSFSPPYAFHIRQHVVACSTLRKMHRDVCAS